MPLPDYTLIRDAQAARREKALPFSLTPVACVNGVSGKVSAGGSWIGVACVFTVPVVLSAFSVVLDVWLNGIDTTGPADLSIPLGEKATVPFQSFAYAVRVVGAPAIDKLTIIAGYDIGSSEEVPNYDHFAAGGGAAAAIASPLAGAPLGGGILVGPVVVASVVSLVSAPDDTGTIALVAPNAATVGGLIQNLHATLPLGLSFVSGTVFVDCAIRLNPAPAADGGGSTIDLSAFPWALGLEIFGATPLAGPGAAGSWTFLGS